MNKRSFSWGTVNLHSSAHTADATELVQKGLQFVEKKIDRS